MGNISVGNKKHGAQGVYVGRPRPLGNPFVLRDAQDDAERDRVCDQYEAWLRDRIEARDARVLGALEEIAAQARQGDVVLVCWCAPKRCHGESVKRVLESMLGA